MRMELKCAVCGRNRFTLDHAAEDDSHVACEECGHQIGTMGELKKRVADEVLRQSAQAR